MHSTISVLDSLQNRVLKVSNPMIPVDPILDQWVEEGREVTEFQFRDLVRLLWQFRRLTHSRQVMEWTRRNYDLCPGFSSDLILKGYALQGADRYFRCIPDVKFGFNTYAKLLRSYVEHERVEEAEAVMKEIKEFHARDITECYDLMLKLYVQMGKYEKLHRLVRN
ncbi:hypothetical protein V8G54_027177 [Vigna mungo]|uniref:Pentatricopeptide repeat-containing protein n=1 Tax=Vigna mungo TaxID=3915 RepID=A0AAQ3N1Y8_VIGMU